MRYMTIIVCALVFGACADETVTSPDDASEAPAAVQMQAMRGGGGVTTTNGWYEEEEIYYIDGGVEEGVTERGENDLYLLGPVPRRYQANVAEFIPGEPGYSPHWNINVVRTAPGETVSDIVSSGYASDLFNTVTREGPLFDDVADILAAEAAGLVTIFKPGVVVLCPIVSEEAAEAPGNNELPEDFEPFPETF